MNACIFIAHTLAYPHTHAHTHTMVEKPAFCLCFVCVRDINLGQILDPTKKVVQQGTGSRYTVLQGRQSTAETDRQSQC